MKLAELFGLSSRRETPSERENGRAVSSLLLACRQLLSERGEISAARLATEILRSYEALDESARELFFDRLVKEFSPNPEKAGQAGDAYRENPSPENLAKLQRAVEPPRQELFRRLNVAPGGTRFLVEMRGHLIGSPGSNCARAPIAADLSHQL